MKTENAGPATEGSRFSTVGVIAAAADGVQTLRLGLIEPLLIEGFRVAVTLTPTAAIWLDDIGERAQLEALTGLPVRSQPRLPSEPKPHPPIDCYVAAPLTANTVAKLALGIADNQALTALAEGLTTRVPVIVFPRINQAHARHPAWPDHLDRLARAGATLIYGHDVWPLAEPGDGVDRKLPWAVILEAVKRSFRSPDMP